MRALRFRIRDRNLKSKKLAARSTHARVGLPEDRVVRGNASDAAACKRVSEIPDVDYPDEPFQPVLSRCRPLRAA